MRVIKSEMEKTPKISKNPYLNHFIWTTSIFCQIVYETLASKLKTYFIKKFPVPEILHGFGVSKGVHFAQGKV
jgi:hypothetical protein